MNVVKCVVIQLFRNELIIIIKQRKLTLKIPNFEVFKIAH